MHDFQQTIAAVLPKVVAWRRHFHQYPELSNGEYKTTEYIIEQIKALPDVTCERPLPTGVVARIQCAAPGPTIALRADIDALPVTEETGLSFSSQNEGVMHACGHDSHAALLLGAMYTLYAHRTELSGAFVFIFQPAEELPPGGAQGMIAAGALDGVDAIIGQHTDPTIHTGQITTRPGAMSAFSDSFTITVTGRGGHASQPQNCLDPLPVAAQIVTALQQVVSRQVAPKDMAVLGIGTFHYGTKNNIISDTAEMTGTVRTLQPATRERMKSMIETIARQYAEAFGMKADVFYQFGYDSTYNTPAYAQALLDLAEALYGPEAAVPADPIMGGEDFAYYLQHVPGAYYHFGITPKGETKFYANHNCHFYIDEESFKTALTMLVQGALKFQELAGKTEP